MVVHHLEDVLVGLREVDLRVDDRQHRRHIDFMLVHNRDKLLGVAEAAAHGGSYTVSVSVNVYKHNIFPFFVNNLTIKL